MILEKVPKLMILPFPIVYFFVLRLLPLVFEKRHICEIVKFCCEICSIEKREKDNYDHFEHAQDF